MMAGRDADAEFAGAVIDTLGRKSKSLAESLVDLIVSMLEPTVRGDMARDDFIERAERAESATMRQHARLASASYRQIVRRLDLEDLPIELPTIPELHDWSDVLDEFDKELEEAGLSAEFDFSPLYSELEDEDEDPVTFDDLLAELESELLDDLDETMTEVQTDVRERTYKRVGKANEVIGYRRVVHPELSRGGSCGLCLVASTMWYTRPDLKPIHDRCHCEVLPVTRTSDPGESLNLMDLEVQDMYEAAAGSTRPAGLKKVRVDASGRIVKKAASADKARDRKTVVKDELAALRRKRRSTAENARMAELRRELLSLRYAA